MKEENFDYTHYLADKKAIDDRSLNPGTWLAFSQWLETRQRQGNRVRILEAGAGIGTMLIRLLDAGLLHSAVYHALEIQAPFRGKAIADIQAWCRAHGCQFELVSDTHWLISNTNLHVECHWRCADLMQLEHDFPANAFDLLLGHAVIDLLPVPAFLPTLLSRLSPAGGCYFTINYAGETSWLPLHALDAEVMAAYHRDMDSRFPALDWQASRTGRLLGDCLRKQDLLLLAEGPSDWQLSPGAGTPESGKRFVANILDTIESALPELPGLPSWLACRRRQLDAGQLQFRAANTDVFAVSR